VTRDEIEVGAALTVDAGENVARNGGAGLVIEIGERAKKDVLVGVDGVVETRGVFIVSVGLGRRGVVG